ncbi:DUF6980 family protein [Candidatus Tisiphia endosymbiont of Hybos culiciformis]|uniref:DUF6980 family protein n=1 Tax=Candidatus Tisiphia endosymbiont of Hybos culiciformis TaxID=3139331 RepID=UPI003CCAB84A
MSITTQQHCCKSMEHFLEEGRVSIGYSAKWRSYYINLKKSVASQDIYHCPWCGTKLPTNLDDEYDNEVSKVMDIAVEDITLHTYEDPNLPEEFKTDEWWKKRGL